jgi:hypothetical protein
MFDGLCRAGDDDGEHWFFQGGSVLRHRAATDSVVLPTAPIAEYWPLLAGTPFEHGIDACYTSYHRPHGYHWLFAGTLAVQYDLAAGVLLKEPASFASIFTLKGADAEFGRGVDALCPPIPVDGNYWFFRDGRMLKYHTHGMGVVANAAPVVEHWPGLAGTVFAEHVAACHTVPGGQHWLFTGDTAAKYDSATHTVLSGPAPVADLLPAVVADLGQALTVDRGDLAPGTGRR